MNHIDFSLFLENSPYILGEGAVIERLRRDRDLELDPDLVNSAFIYDAQKRAALETIYREYMDIGYEYGMPLLISTPTWRASQERIRTAGYKEFDVNGDNLRFLDALRKSYGSYGEKIVICGLLSCCGDAYNPTEALTVEQALDFHSWQAEKLAESGVDRPGLVCRPEPLLGSGWPAGAATLSDLDRRLGPSPGVGRGPDHHGRTPPHRGSPPPESNPVDAHAAQAVKATGRVGPGGRADGRRGK